MYPHKSNDPSILIIGAGIGGLGLAQGLKKIGFQKVTVLERDSSPSSRRQGYRITMRTLGLSALKELLPKHLLDRLPTAKISDVGDGFTFANEKMEPLFQVKSGQDFATQLLRSELRELMLDGVHVAWNKRLTHIETRKDCIIAHFEDGSQYAADFLIGCDGVSSKVRELLPTLDGARITSIPKICNLEGVIYTAQINRTTDWEKSLELNRSGMVRFLGPGSTYLGVTFSENADRNPAIFWGITEKKKNNKDLFFSHHEKDPQLKILDHCKSLLKEGNWHPTLKKLVNATTPEDILAPWILKTAQFPEKSSPLPMLPSGRVTLLGDAAHAMPPGKGLGGSNVLEDARILTQLFKDSSRPFDWSKLTATYEKEMFERTKTVAEESSNVEDMHDKIRLMDPKNATSG